MDVGINELLYNGCMTENDKKILAKIHSRSGETVSDLMFWTFRYFVGRQTIAASQFARALADCWEHLNPRIQALIKRELNNIFEEDDKARSSKDLQYEFYPLGSDIDRENWELVRQAYYNIAKTN